MTAIENRAIRIVKPNPLNRFKTGPNPAIDTQISSFILIQSGHVAKDA